MHATPIKKFKGLTLCSVFSYHHLLLLLLLLNHQAPQPQHPTSQFPTFHSIVKPTNLYMAPMSQFCLFISTILVLHDLIQISRSQRVCDIMSCGDIENIQFPFRLNQDCSYYPNPSFKLTCNNHTQTILKLPHTEDLVVKNIDYEKQVIQVNDPDGCLPKRFLHNNFNLSLLDSPFKLNPAVYGGYFNLTFLSCPYNLTGSSRILPSIPCLSGDPKSRDTAENTNSSSSVVIWWWSRPIEPSPLSGVCEVISSALVPIQTPVDMGEWPLWPDLMADIELSWTEPMCRECAISGQVCGFAKDRKSLSQVGCFSSPPSKSQGITSSVKYGLTIGVGVPGLLCLIGLFCFLFGKAKVNIHRRQRPMRDLPTISLQPMTIVMGLDGDTIEKYPKTLLGESGRLLKPSDNTCSICLCEYQPKETLRTIPECNHYFHADCIDEWLRLNATCPLCRNTPGASSFSSLSNTSSLSLSSTP